MAPVAAASGRSRERRAAGACAGGALRLDASLRLRRRRRRRRIPPMHPAARDRQRRQHGRDASSAQAGVGERVARGGRTERRHPRDLRAQATLGRTPERTAPTARTRAGNKAHIRHLCHPLPPCVFLYVSGSLFFHTSDISNKTTVFEQIPRFRCRPYLSDHVQLTELLSRGLAASLDGDFCWSLRFDASFLAALCYEVAEPCVYFWRVHTRRDFLSYILSPALPEPHATHSSQKKQNRLIRHTPYCFVYTTGICFLEEEDVVLFPLATHNLRFFCTPPLFCFSRGSSKLAPPYIFFCFFFSRGSCPSAASSVAVQGCTFSSRSYT